VAPFSMTEDHKPSIPAEQERIERCGGTVSMDRVDGMLAMSRAMGDAEYKRPGPTLRVTNRRQTRIRILGWPGPAERAVPGRTNLTSTAQSRAHPSG